MNTILTIFLYILLIVSNPIVEAIKITHNPPNTPPPTNICSGTYSDYLQMNKIPPPARTTPKFRFKKSPPPPLPSPPFSPPKSSNLPPFNPPYQWHLPPLPTPPHKSPPILAYGMRFNPLRIRGQHPSCRSGESRCSTSYSTRDQTQRQIQTTDEQRTEQTKTAS